ncbi:F-actin-monooxygenase mical1-like isoform X2 [Mytilus edulis]|uniref:F-actin-monooxygenase mical1-like isoform X2 n=1 Tax=Mytilus edulis TaxID=6550 RepID=UPI0039EE511D
MEEFKDFTESHTCKETLKAFEKLCVKLGLDNVPHEEFFDQLSYGLSKNWKFKRFLDHLKNKFQDTEKGGATKILIVGAGPCGLRIAIETAFLGCKVVLIDKRDAFTRNNVLHLWPFTVTDLKNIGIKQFFGRFCCGELDHISIRRLQLSLLKIALVVGVEVHTNVEFEGLKCPQKNGGTGWKAVCKPHNHKVSDFEFDVLVAATGARDALCEYKLQYENGIVIKQGFDRKEFRGRLSIAITANFVNSNTPAEMKTKEIGGVSSHFHQQLFKDLKTKKKIHLENFVYYKDETHYFVMTATKASLLQRRVFKEDFLDASQLMERKNIDVQSLLAYARDAANFCTNNAMANISFAKNSRGVDDVAMLDFSSKFEAANASHVVERNGKKLLIGLIGDSLLEPFWPQGTGCARGFLGAFDTAWMIKNWKSMNAKPLEIIAERECVYKVLSQTTPNNIKKKYSDYTIDPKSRYPSINMKAVTANKAKQFYDDVQDDYYEDVVSPAKKIKRTDETVEFNDLLQWCQKVLKQHIQYNITDLTTSWRSGCEIGCLIHVFRPHLIQMKNLDPLDRFSTMETVVNIAQRELGIYPVITVLKMVNCSSENEVEMALYLTQFYQLFHEENIPENISSDNGGISNTTTYMTETNIVKPREGRFEVPMENDKTVEAGNDTCYICNTELFMMERLSVESVFCHRACLKCERCHCELNLENYRTQKSSKGRVRFFCPKHAGPNAKFTQSIRKRPSQVLDPINEPQPLKERSNIADRKRVPKSSEKPKIPPRPDFLARRVTSASIRRKDFYNTADDNKEVETEDKIFEHNFGASVRRAMGTFSIKLPKSDDDENDKSSSESSDDDIEERLEATLGPNIDKHITIKDASQLWQTLRRDTKQRSIIQHMQDISDETDATPDPSQQKLNMRPNRRGNERDTIQEDENEELESRISAASEIDGSNIYLRNEKQITENRKSSKNEEMLEKAIKDLNRESREFDDRRFKFSATCYRPKSKGFDKGPAANQLTKGIHRSRPLLKRSDSDQTEVRHAQRVQLAARKLAIQRQQNKLFMAQEIKRQLEEAEVELCDVEQQGVEIEKQLKENAEILEENKQTLRRQLCSLYTRRQKLLQYEAELQSANDQFLPPSPKEEISEISPRNSSSEEEEYVIVEKYESQAFGIDNVTKKTSVEAVETDKMFDMQNPSEIANDVNEVAPKIISPDVKSTPNIADDGSQSEATGGDILSAEIEKLTFVDEYTTGTQNWECPFCTLYNDDTNSFCDACEAWKCSMCTYVNDTRKKKCEMCYNNKPQLDVHHNELRESDA